MVSIKLPKYFHLRNRTFIISILWIFLFLIGCANSIQDSSEKNSPPTNTANEEKTTSPNVFKMPMSTIDKQSKDPLSKILKEKQINVEHNSGMKIPCSSLSLGQWNLMRSTKNSDGFQETPLGQSKPKILSNLTLKSDPISESTINDINNDGQLELLIQDVNGLGAWSIQGDLIWHFKVEDPEIVSVSDINADKTKEIVIVSKAKHIHIISGKYGYEKFFVPIPSGVKTYEYNVYVGNYISDITGEQLLIVSNVKEESTGLQKKIESSMYGFLNNNKHIELLWKQTIQENTSKDPKFIHWARSTLGDLDNDGITDLIAFIENGFVLVNLSNGIIKGRFDDINGGRNYGTYVVTDLNNDGKNELAILADIVNQHIDVVQWNKNQTGNILWQTNKGAVWPNGISSLHIPSNKSVANVTGNYSKEIIYSEWTPKKGWKLNIIDSLDGKTIFEKEGEYVVWTGDLNGDGISEIISTKENFLLPERFSNLTISSYSQGKLETLYEVENAWIQGKEEIRRLSLDERYPLIFDWDNDGYLEFIIGQDHDKNGSAENFFIIGYNGDYFDTEIKIPNVNKKYHGVIGVEVIGEENIPSVMLSTIDSDIITMDLVHGKIIGKVSTIQSYNWKYRIVDTNNDCINELLIEDANGVALIDPLTRKELWRFPGKLLTSGELDHNPGTEVVIVQTAPEGGIELNTITKSGISLWKTSLHGLSNSHLVETIKDSSLGYFTGRNNHDIYLSGRHSIPTGSGDSDRSWLLKGDSGEIVWYNDASDKKLGIPSLGPGKKAGSVPFDWNGDGFDDIVMISNIDFVVLNGINGTLLIDPIKIINALQEDTEISWQWTAYGAITLLTSIADNKDPEFLVHNSSGAWGPLSIKTSHPFISGLWNPIPVLKEGANRYAATGNVDQDENLEIIPPENPLKIYDLISGQKKYEFSFSTDPIYVSIARKSNDQPASIVVSHFQNLSLLQVENGKLTKKWTQNFGLAVGPPVLGDLDGDGISEIVISLYNGDLLIISNSL